MRYARQSATDGLRLATVDLHPATDGLHFTTDGLQPDTSMSIKTLRSLSYWKDLFNFGSVL